MLKQYNLQNSGWYFLALLIAYSHWWGMMNVLSGNYIKSYLNVIFDLGMKYYGY